MTRIKRLTNPYRAVFGSYLHRRLFWLLVAGYALHFDRLIMLALSEIGVHGDSAVWQVYFVASDVIDPLMQIAFPVVVAVMLMAHLREQLAGHSRILVPYYVRPTLRSAVVVFAFTMLAISVMPFVTDVLYTFMNRLDYPPDRLVSSAWEAYHWSFYNLPGGLIVTCTAMTVAAWFASFGTPWITLALAPVLGVALLASRINPWTFYYLLVRDRFYVEFYTVHFRWGFFFWYLNAWRFFLLFICVPILFNAVALVALYRRIHRLAKVRKIDDAASSIRQSKVASVILRRPKLPTAWSRLRHLRAAGISAFAPWVVALLVCAVLMLIPTLLINSHHPEIQMQISMILVTNLPSVAVALLWAERWPRLEVESLLPASRQRFVTEIIAAMAIDLLHFWIAITSAAIVALVVMPIAPIHADDLLARMIIASALMQPLALAAILWAMWFRSWPVLATLLCIAMAAMAGPVAYSTKTVPLIPVSTLLHTSLVAGLIGLSVSAAAYRRWLTGDFA